MKSSINVSIEADGRIPGRFKLAVTQAIPVEVFLPLLLGAKGADLPAVEGLTIDEAKGAKIRWDAYIASGLKKCKIGLATSGGSA